MAQTAKHGTNRGESVADLSSVELFQKIESLSGELSDLLDSNSVLRAFTQKLVEENGVSVAGIWLTNSAESELELGPVAGKPIPSAHAAKMKVGECLLGRAVRERQPQVMSHEDEDPLTHWARQQKVGFLAAYPLFNGTKIQGVLMVGCLKAPSKTLLGLLRLQATLVSVTLRDTELLASTRQTLNKLSILVEASKALSSTLDLSELLSRILDVAKSQADAERGTLFLVDEKSAEIWSLIAHGLEKQEIRLPLGKGIAGHVAKSGEIVNIPDAYADPRFNPEVDRQTGYHTRNILCLPMHNKAGKVIAALQLLNKRTGSFTDDDVDFLMTLSGHMALALENAQLHQQILDKERMEKELALARGIQRSLLPETAPLVEGFDIALLNEPCYAVGGDYYDFLSLGPRTILVVVADVEGKGVSSALVMSNLQATLRALVLHLHSLNEIAEALNRMMWNDTRAEKYLSLFMGLIDVRRKAIHYINCGHVPPVVVRPNHEPIQLTEGGMVVGLFENPPYERGQKKFESGDVLVLCTDGITESMDAHHEEFGSERLIECVSKNADKNAAEIVEAVNGEVTRFSRHGTHIDDKVMIAIKVM